VAQYSTDEFFNHHNERFSVSYVTGSHAFKVGLTTMQGKESYGLIYVNESLAYQFLRGMPVSLTQYASPPTQDMRVKMNMALYAQEQSLRTSGRTLWPNRYETRQRPTESAPGAFPICSR